MSAAPLRRRAQARPAAARPAAPARPAVPGRARPSPARRPVAPARGLVRPRGAVLLDRLLSGRLWIGLVFLLLVGIVFFNVDLLRMNRDIAVTAEKAETIKRQNARLRGDLARLGSSERIQKVAAESGLVLPAPGEVRYLKTNTGVDARNALGMLKAGPQTGAADGDRPAPSGEGAPGQGQTQPTAVPQAPMPQTEAPSAGSAPQTTAPQTTAPQTTPQTTAPQAPSAPQVETPTAPQAGQ